MKRVFLLFFACVPLLADAQFIGTGRRIKPGAISTEIDPTVSSDVKSITSTNISNWITAFSWGNHASGGYVTLTGGQNISGNKRFTASQLFPTGIPLLWYNTSDETTNYERGYVKWVSNNFEIGTEIGGTGTNRPVRIAAGATTLSLTIANTSPRYLFAGTSGANNQHIVSTNGSYTSGGSVYYHSFSAYPTIGNSGTSTYTAYFASPLSGGISTGEKKLLDLGTNSSNTGDLSTHTSVFKVLFDGTTTIGGSVRATQFRLSALNAAPSSATDTGTTGEIRVTSGFIYICTATNTWVRAALSTW